MLLPKASYIAFQYTLHSYQFLLSLGIEGNIEITWSWWLVCLMKVSRATVREITKHTEMFMQWY